MHCLIKFIIARSYSCGCDMTIILIAPKEFNFGGLKSALTFIPLILTGRNITLPVEGQGMVIQGKSKFFGN